MGGVDFWAKIMVGRTGGHDFLGQWMLIMAVANGRW